MEHDWIKQGDPWTGQYARWKRRRWERARLVTAGIGLVAFFAGMRRAGSWVAGLSIWVWLVAGLSISAACWCMTMVTYYNTQLRDWERGWCPLCRKKSEGTVRSQSVLRVKCPECGVIQRGAEKCVRCGYAFAGLPAAMAQSLACMECGNCRGVYEMREEATGGL